MTSLPHPASASQTGASVFGTVPRIRAPGLDGELVSRPRLDDFPRLAESNHRLLDRSRLQVQGLSLAELRAWSQRTLWEFIHKSRADNLESRPDRWLVTGHQPDLFHCGVWAKNFAVSASARVQGGTGFSLVVDADIQPVPAIQVPVRKDNRVLQEVIPYDNLARIRVPWEEATIAEVDIWEQFPGRVRRAMQDWQIAPILDAIWPTMNSAVKRGCNLAEAFVSGRQELEQAFGYGNHEFYQSHWCDTAPARWFICHLLARLPRFTVIHNEIVRAFRRRNQIRSKMHPVPDLATVDGWFESPFWVWHRDDPHRKRLFAKAHGTMIRLRADTNEFGALTLTPAGDAQVAIEELRKLAESGWKIRTRALTTTLLTRLCLAHVFVHGIGGAQYDRITDEICLRFFGMAPPDYVTLTATRHLPISRPEMPVVTRQDLGLRSHDSLRTQTVPQPASGQSTNNEPLTAGELRHRLRQIYWNPHHFLKVDAPQVQPVLAEYLALVDEIRQLHLPGRSERRRELQQRLRALRNELQRWTVEAQETAAMQLKQLELQQSNERVTCSREFSFVLFPEDSLRNFFTKLFPLPRVASIPREP